MRLARFARLTIIVKTCIPFNDGHRFFFRQYCINVLFNARILFHHFTSYTSNYRRFGLILTCDILQMSKSKIE